MAYAQKALVVTDIGQPVVFVYDHAIPEPGPNQVQIKVTVAGLNPHDRKSRDAGLFISQSLPAVLANDVVGKVVTVGQGVTGITIGDRIVSQAVFAPGSLQNGLQEYALAAVGSMAKVPDSITDDEAATLPTNIIAPLVALFKVLEIPAPWSPTAEDFDYVNASILIVGGGSNCGKFSRHIVIDRHAGYDVVLGRVREMVGDDLVYAFDSVNPPDGQILALNALSSRKRGTLARLLPLGPIDESKVLGKKAGFDVRNVFGSSQVHPELAGPFWERVPEYLEAGKLKSLSYVVKQGLEAGNVSEVLDAYRDGNSVFKTHIHL
ncbi:chaperonin 10-like protein [Lipomyces doorenjongii]